jgi:hypothetical protein
MRAAVQCLELTRIGKVQPSNSRVAVTSLERLTLYLDLRVYVQERLFLDLPGSQRLRVYPEVSQVRKS